MSAVLIGSAVALVVCLGALSIWRSSPRSLDRVSAGGDPGKKVSFIASLMCVIGNSVFTLLGKSSLLSAFEPTDTLKQRAGMGVVASSVLMVVSPSWGVATVIGWTAWMCWAERAGHLGRDKALRVELPFVLALARLSLSSDGNVRTAVEAIARFGQGEIADRFAGVLRSGRHGVRIADAIEAIPETTGEVVRPLTSALVSAERYGSPVAAVLDALALDARLDLDRRAERTARELSVHLLLPLAGFTLPAFALLTVAPLLVGSLGSLTSSFH